MLMQELAAFLSQSFCSSALTWASQVFLQRMARHVVLEWPPTSGMTLLHLFLGVPGSVLGGELEKSPGHLWMQGPMLHAFSCLLSF